MAAPTDVRVEALSITTTMIRWTYAGSNQISVYRSTDGASYAEVTILGTRVESGTTQYNDTGLAVATKYWYKLSDDEGSTFSSVVTVWTHDCGGDVGDPFGLIELPRFDVPEGMVAEVSDSTIQNLNEMARRIESAFGDQPPPLDECIACPSDGAVLIDCSNGCVNWTVIADADINSISINWCNKFDGKIDFIIPPDTTVGICGFPQGFGFTGDECFQAPIPGGSTGRKLSVGYKMGGNVAQWAGTTPGTGKGVGPGVGKKDNRKSSNPGGGGSGSEDGNTGGGGGGSGCTCVPTADGGLTIKSCNANNSLDCSGDKKLDLIVCGGRGPYTWSNTGSVSLNRTSGNRVTVTPPANSGGSVAGIAYQIENYYCSSCSGSTCNTATLGRAAQYGCDDVFDQCDASPLTCTTAPSAGDLSYGCSGGVWVGTDDVSCPTLTSANGIQKTCDKRTAGMISDGCNPCGLQAGATVSVTDALGTVTTIILQA